MGAIQTPTKLCFVSFDECAIKNAKNIVVCFYASAVGWFFRRVWIVHSAHCTLRGIHLFYTIVHWIQSIHATGIPIVLAPSEPIYYYLQPPVPVKVNSFSGFLFGNAFNLISCLRLWFGLHVYYIWIRAGAYLFLITSKSITITRTRLMEERVTSNWFQRARCTYSWTLVVVGPT